MTERNLLKNESIDNKFVSKKFVPRTPMDQQRIRVEKLMEHPEKPVIIPTPSNQNKEKKFLTAIPTFVRNVMGSSAGAGSGEFHVYRHLRRKEYARQKHIQQKSKQEMLDDEFQQRIEKNRNDADAKTAKKRAKRLKKKEKQKKARKNNDGKKVAAVDAEEDEASQSESSSDDNEGSVNSKDIATTEIIDKDIESADNIITTNVENKPNDTEIESKTEEKSIEVEKSEELIVANVENKLSDDVESKKEQENEDNAPNNNEEISKTTETNESDASKTQDLSNNSENCIETKK